ncbi:MAG TPA: hypothetical protein DDW56_20810, partial [Cyanobacteria bacterium UBA11366]|nr:hypothetical protein [Cyanobacteria bacterium UBA11366]
LLPPFTRGAGGVKTLAKTSIFAFIGMLPGNLSNYQLSTVNYQLSTIKTPLSGSNLRFFLQ